MSINVSHKGDRLSSETSSAAKTCAAFVKSDHKYWKYRLEVDAASLMATQDKFAAMDLGAIIEPDETYKNGIHRAHHLDHLIGRTSVPDNGETTIRASGTSDSTTETSANTPVHSQGDPGISSITVDVSTPTICTGAPAKRGSAAAEEPGAMHENDDSEIFPYDFSLVAVCFCTGTLIGTPAGEVAVEKLKVGDLVSTADGRALPVRWIGRQTLSTRLADPLRVLPIRICAGALADGVPSRDLLVSPDHALLVGGLLVQAGALVNGTTILREHRVPEVLAYWHVELAEHTLILAEGAPAETFVDTAESNLFDNWPEYESMMPAQASVSPMDLPRARSHRQVPSAIRAVLDARARATAPATD